MRGATSVRLQGRRACVPACGQGGVTLAEAVVAIAVLGVLAALAAPAFNGVFQRWQIQRAVSGLHHALHLARSEAVRRGGHIALQKLAGNTCGGADGNLDWDCGWHVCVNANDDGKCAVDDAVLYRLELAGSVRVTRSGGTDSVRFDRWGTVAGAWPSFGVYPAGTSTAHPATRRLCMSSGGRVRVIAAATCG